MSALPAGSCLGPYEILGALGAGGMGEVYRARDPRLGREVAIKVLPAELTSSADRLRRFEQEARAAAALNHPNVVTVHDVGSFEGAPFLVTELLEGQTLRERLRAGALPPREAIEVAAQIARGLGAAHERGIVHRDLKPENVFLTRDGRAKVLDFGIAKLTRREAALASPLEAATLTDGGAVLGTAAYMSPEQVRGEPADHRSDLFSLGTVMHEMLSGKNPFLAPTSAETMTAILKAEPPPLPAEVLAALPALPTLPAVVARLLEKRPEDRFQSASDVAFVLVTLPDTAPPSKAPRAAPRLRRRRWLAAAAAVPVLIAFGAAVRAHYASGPPTFRRLTFRRGHILSARFAPDGLTVLYAAMWGGRPFQVYATRAGEPETNAVSAPDAVLLGVSARGEMALSLRPTNQGYSWTGTLARASVAGGAPRELVEKIQEADFSPDGAALAVVRVLPEGNGLEYPIGTVLYTTRGRIGQPRLSPDATAIAFTDHPSIEPEGSLAVVDRSGRKRVLSSGWNVIDGVAWAGSEVWFTASKTGKDRELYAVSLFGHERQVRRWGGDWMLHDVGPKRRVLASQMILRLAVTSWSPSGEMDLSWLDWSNARDLSPDGAKVLIDEFGAGVGARHVAYLRGTDGSPAVRLGDGIGSALSPDGRWVLVERSQPTPELVLLPTGPGSERSLPRGTVERLLVGKHYYSAAFFPDGRRFVFEGAEKRRPGRLFVQDVEGGLPRPFGPEGLSNPRISSDGASVAAVALDEKTLRVLDAQGEVKASAELEPGLLPIQWSADGLSVFARQREGMLTRIFRLWLATGKKELVREIRPPDPAGIISSAFNTFVTPDGSTFVCTFLRSLDDLYLVEGLK